ncbi:Uncharacterised protein [uncultured archaeon]|nr:Uncharacterised protein [uncultured archaeon]
MRFHSESIGIERTAEGSSHSYDHFIERSKTGNSDFDRYLTAYACAADSLRKNPQDPYTMQEAERFLRRHAEVSYKEFVDRCHPERIEAESYGLLQKGKLRRDLFERRALLYLCALEIFEEEGGNIEEILERIRKSKTPPIKNSRQEPTFEAIYKLLKR